MSLSNCMRKAGNALTLEDRAAILGRSKTLREGGLSVAEAARQAVTERIAEVQGLIGGWKPPTKEAASALDTEVELGPAAKPATEAKAEPQEKTTSWVIREKATGDVVLETFDPRKVEALNTEKYEAVPIREHLASLNRKKPPTEPGPKLSRLAADGRPAVHVQSDENGNPTFHTAAVSIDFPQQTERFEVIPGPGEQVLNYAVMSPSGFDVLGFVELLVKDGKPISLLDIEITNRIKGRGRAVIEALLSAYPDADLNISNVVPAARGFWERMGVPVQNVGEGDAYDGTLNWKAYAEAKNRSGADGDAQASRGPREEGDASAARSVRGSPQGLSRAEAEAIMALPEETLNKLLGRTLTLSRLKVIADGFGAVPIRAVQSVNDMPATERQRVLDKAPDGKIRGAYFKGADTIWLVADNLHSEAEATFVALHESFHRGLAKTIGPEAKKLLRWMHTTNASLRKATKVQMDRHGISQDEAIEEALADMAGEGKARDLRGWSKLVALIRAWLTKAGEGLGFNIKWSDDMIADFVAGTARAGMQGDVRVNPAADASMSRGEQDAGDAMLSRTPIAIAIREQALPAGYKVSDFITSHGKLGFWHKTVGTMHNLAQRNALFKPVYDGAQHFLNDVSYYATEAADLAPTLLPKLEGLRDIAKSPLSAEDTRAIAGPIFEGTLNWTRDDDGNAVRTEQVERAGVVWTDDELRDRWKLTDKQIGLYREMRAAVDRSLTDLAVSDMIRYGGIDVVAARDAALAAKDVNEAAQVLVDHLQRAAEADPKRAELLNDTAGRIQEKAERAADLMARGYAPLSRFGQYTLDVIGKDGERVYFGLFESQADANRMARRLKESHPDANFAQGTLSQEAYKLFAGVSPETLELFGDMLGLESEGDDAASQAFQTYIKIAKSNRSALKRLIERKGIQGFNEDAGRVLAGFVYSNARQSSKNLHFGELSKAVSKIAEDKGQGELLDAAVQLHQYITNPQEEAHKIRGLLFAQFLGGSLAAGIVNLTQSFSVTFPYLTQYGGVKKAASQMRRALQDAVKWETGNRTTGDKALDAAIKKAEEEGIVSPQEVHHLLAQAGGRGSLKAGDGTKAGDLSAKASNFGSKLMLAWGRPFAIAEQFNRRAAFIAGYRTAVDQGIADPAGFAAGVVTETQFSYTKANKPKWARGAIGSTLFTFKTFSISYVELLTRMAKSGPEGKRAALVGLAMLFLMSGMQGLPGADDLDDVIDGALQRLGYNFSSKQAKREFLAGILGEGGAMFVMKGLSGLPGVPIDVSGRLGMGNLIPGTGLLTKKDDHGRDVAELLGPVGRLAEQALKGGDALVQGEVMRAAQAVAPVAAANLLKGYDMASMGMYRDDKGRKVIDTDATDAVMKAIGFQPNDVAKVQQATMEVQKMIALNKLRESEIAAKLATGMFEKDWDKVKDAQQELRDWNAANPSSKIVITPQQIGRRLKDMRSSKDERIARTAPKEIRAEVKRELEAAR